MQFHGVDFAGGDDGGTHKIRVASWREGQPISIVRVDRRGLVRLVLASAQEGSASVWRIDAASGLPLATLGAHGQPAARVCPSASHWQSTRSRTRPARCSTRLFSCCPELRRLSLLRDLLRVGPTSAASRSDAPSLRIPNELVHLKLEAHREAILKYPLCELSGRKSQ